MTSRERVVRTLTFTHPDRAPRDLWYAADKWTHTKLADINPVLKKFPLDIAWPKLIHVGWSTDTALEKKFTKGKRWGPGMYVEHWGCAFQILQEGVIGEVKNPMMKSLSDVNKVELPYKYLECKMERINESWELSDRFVLGGTFLIAPFERMQFLRGTPSLYMDMMDQPAEFFELRDIVHKYYLKEIQLWTQTGVDGIMFADDWGSERSLLIAPCLWRELFKPLYKDYCDLIHNAGKFAFMHSDGHIFEIYEDLIEIGVDAVNSQLFCMDIEEIGRKFKGRMTFWGEIDGRRILISSDLDEVRGAVRRWKGSLYDERGGVIAQCVKGKRENLEVIFGEWENV